MSILFFVVLIEFSADPANAAIITQCSGVPLIIQCLSSPVRNTVSDKRSLSFVNALNLERVP